MTKFALHSQRSTVRPVRFGGVPVKERMHMLTRATTAVLVFFAIGAVPARAADLCVNTGGIQFVLKKFSLPGKGSCKAINGFSPRTNGPVIVSGSVCLNSNGDTLRIGFTQHPAGIEAMRIFQVDVPFPALGTAGWTEVAIRTADASTFSDSGVGAVGPCNPATPPIP